MYVRPYSSCEIKVLGLGFRVLNPNPRSKQLNFGKFLMVLLEILNMDPPHMLSVPSVMSVSLYKLFKYVLCASLICQLAKK